MITRMRHKHISRQALIDAVEASVWRLREAGDRNAVREFARSASQFAASAWCADGCYCPSSGVGIDRLRIDAQEFATAFDDHLGATTMRPWVCTVYDGV